MGNSSPPPWPSGPDPQDRSVPEHSQVWASPSQAEGAGGPDTVWAWPPPVQPPRPRTDEPPPGVPYHRMGRTERHRWWRPLLALVYAALLSVGMSVFVLVVLELVKAIQRIPAPAGKTGHPVGDLAVGLLMNIMFIPAVLIVVRFVLKRRGGSLSSVEGRLRWSWLLRCAAAAAGSALLFLAVFTVLLLVTEPGSPVLGEYAGTGVFVAALAVIVLLVPFQAAAEEYATRGFLMQTVGAYGEESRSAGSAPAARVNRLFVGPLPGILVSGLVFTLLHDYTAWALADVATFGVAMAWLTWYTGGLEAAIALHTVHNMVVFALSAYEGTLGRTEGVGSWQGALSLLVEVGTFCLVVVWMRRRRGIRRTTPGDPAPRSADALASRTHGA